MAVVAELDPDKDSLLLASMGLSIIGLVMNCIFIGRGGSIQARPRARKHVTKKHTPKSRGRRCPAAAKPSGSADLNEMSTETQVIEMVSNPLATRSASREHAEYAA